MNLVKDKSKMFFIGISLAENSQTDTGIAIIDNQLNIVTLEKFYFSSDIELFLNSFSSLKDSFVLVSLPENPEMLQGKWRFIGRAYQLVGSNKLIRNQNDWTDRFSKRCCEYFLELKEKGIDIRRCELNVVKQSLKIDKMFKNRTPSDCKYIQNTLKHKFGFMELPSNMLPVSLLEALLNAVFAHKIFLENKEPETLFTYKGLDIIK